MKMSPASLNMLLAHSLGIPTDRLEKTVSLTLELRVDEIPRLTTVEHHTRHVDGVCEWNILAVPKHQAPPALDLEALAQQARERLDKWLTCRLTEHIGDMLRHSAEFAAANSALLGINTFSALRIHQIEAANKFKEEEPKFKIGYPYTRLPTNRFVSDTTEPDQP